MSFTSNTFVFFLAAFFLPYFTVRQIRTASKLKHGYIALWSLVFYAMWYPPALLLIGFHTFLALFGAAFVANKRSRWRICVLVAVALAPLAFFKEYDFFITLFELEEHRLGLILPLGISFYTFSVIGYYIDVYRGKVRPLSSIGEITLFVAFWPHLASGPILRADNISANLENAEELTIKNLDLSLVLVASGLVKKLLIADNIGAYVNWNLSYGVERLSCLEAWATMAGFSVQIYADFSGYSDMAIGFALLLGFRLSANFNYPYRAATLTDFWRRWHISLSTWFRDYVFIPLGGSRGSTARVCLNIMIVFVLSGVWHGTGLNFAVWGALHGALLCLEKVSSKRYLRIPITIRWPLTTMFVVVAWTFFRLEIRQAWVVVTKMFGFGSTAAADGVISPYYVMPLLMMLAFPVIDHLVQFYRVRGSDPPELNRRPVAVVGLSLLLIAAFVFNGQELPFIYFEF